MLCFYCCLRFYIDTDHPSFESKLLFIASVLKFEHPSYESKHPFFESEYPFFESECPSFESEHPFFESEYPSFENDLPSFEPELQFFASILNYEHLFFNIYLELLFLNLQFYYQFLF